MCPNRPSPTYRQYRVWCRLHWLTQSAWVWKEAREPGRTHANTGRACKTQRGQRVLMSGVIMPTVQKFKKKTKHAKIQSFVCLNEIREISANTLNNTALIQSLDTLEVKTLSQYPPVTGSQKVVIITAPWGDKVIKKVRSTLRLNPFCSPSDGILITSKFIINHSAAH